MKNSNQIDYNIEVYIVFTKKDKSKILHGYTAQKCRDIIFKSCNEMEIDIIQGKIDKDCVHLLLSILPSNSVDEIVKLLKDRTSKALENDMWNDGYFCQSVGKVSKRAIKVYVDDKINNEKGAPIIETEN